MSLSLVVTFTLAFGKGRSRIKKVYERGTFRSTCTIYVHCNDFVCNDVVDDFVSQFVGDPNALFDWALKGMGRSDDESKNEILLVLKEANYDKSSGVSVLIVDVNVAGVMKLTDQRVESEITQKHRVDGSYDVGVDIKYSNSLLKKADGMFFVKPLAEDLTELKIEINIKFGWFFNIFITQYRYKNMFEWRCQGFMENMATEMERRCSK